MGSEVKDLLATLKEQKLEIEQLLTDNMLAQAEENINRYGSLVNNADYYILKATLHFQKGEAEQTREILLEALRKHPFHFEIHMNLGVVYEALNDSFTGTKHYAYAAKYAPTAMEKEEGISNLERLITELTHDRSINQKQLDAKIVECNKIMKEGDARAFPFDQHGESLIRKVMHAGTAQEYMFNMYKSHAIIDATNGSRLYFKTEMFKGNEAANEANVELLGPSIVPVSLIDPLTAVEFTINDNHYSFSDRNLALNRYHYLKFNETGMLKVEANKPIFVGHPIPVATEPKKPRLVLKIFIDGLSYKFLEQNSLAEIMPNAYAFFSNGFISTNSYAASEWTLPSKASVNTGRYSTNHRLLHPDYMYSFERYSKLLSEYLKDAGYFTANINNNWRTTPTFGYYKGFDRILYQNFIGGMDCRDVIMEAIEHIEAFGGINQYLSISMMDLHNVPDEIENNLYAQVHTDIYNRLDTKNKGETSVLTKYDENKIVKYYEEIKRVDFFLGILFDFLSKKYADDELLIVMHSDHGQTFLESEDSILHESRRKIPLMVRGHGVMPLVSDEIIESIDILPIILDVCGLAIPEDIDGKLPKCFGGEQERNFAVTHVIHPNQSYRVAISDSLHQFQLETKANVGTDLSINLDSYTITLTNKQTGEEEADAYCEKVSLYEKHIFEQIKDFIKLT
ncbi:sulfatase-like hydrolase/transferase [Paenibacillus sp. YIM B09110]|uniref:sulfatase-like hydrolase/transferase n=1 Tax=Paenibacillus sp. YIM B09110 TaxID=3126102 RepID=UPI00301C514D